MALKTTKRIWYGSLPPMVNSGQIDPETKKPIMVPGSVNGIFDKRVKDIKPGQDVPDDIQDHIAVRMMESGHLVEKLSLEDQLRIQNENAEKEAEKKKAKA